MNDLPHNIEAEQALLGAILSNNDLLHKCVGLAEEHFFDPVHARIFAVSKALIDDGKVASPVTLKFPMQDDEGLKELGGPAYLVRFVGAAITVWAAPDYAKTIQELAARRELIIAAGDACERAMTADGGTVAEIRSDLDDKLHDYDRAGQNDVPYQPFIQSINTAVENIVEAYQSGNPPGLLTGIKAIDDFLGGFNNGMVYMLAGRPGMAKTAIALNIANRAECGVVFGSLEMPGEKLATRTLSQKLKESGYSLPYRNIDNNWLNETDVEKLVRVAVEIENSNIVTIEPSNTELSKLKYAIRGAIREVEKKNKLGLIVIDFIQRIQVKGATSFDTLNMSINYLKDLALEYDVPVLVLSQVNLKVESSERKNKRPNLSDLRGSGELGEQADVVMFCYREAYYLEQAMKDETDIIKKEDIRLDILKIENDLELIVAKQKNGPTGTIHLGCDIKYNHLFDKDRQDDLAF